MTLKKAYPGEWDEIGESGDGSSGNPEEGSPPNDPITRQPDNLDRRIVLRHAGGSFKEVFVLSALDNGVLFVQWPESVGSLPYALNVFRVWKENGAGWLYKKPSSRTPLHWRAFDLEKAQALWRTMTGREGKREWERVWKNGKTVWAEKKS